MEQHNPFSKNQRKFSKMFGGGSKQERILFDCHFIHVNYFKEGEQILIKKHGT